MGKRTAMNVVAAVLAVTVLAGCGDGGDATDGTTDDPTSIDPALLECGEAAESEMQLPDVDLTAATWEMPEGFVETFAYSEDFPVEHIDTYWVAEPESDPTPLNVLTVVGYSELDWGDDVDECGRVPVTAVDERLSGYNEHNEAEPLTDTVETEIAGLHALEQEVALAEYEYRGYWIFSRSQLLHIYCQWTNDADEATILSACNELIESVQVPGA